MGMSIVGGSGFGGVEALQLAVSGNGKFRFLGGEFNGASLRCPKRSEINSKFLILVGEMRAVERQPK